jgi:hypothetical protein
LFDSCGEAPVKRLSQLIREDIDFRVGLENAADFSLFYTFCEDILCGRYVAHEMICTVLRLNIFESIVVYSRALRHNLIPEMCYPDRGGVF